MHAGPYFGYIYLCAVEENGIKSIVRAGHCTELQIRNYVRCEMEMQCEAN